MIFSLLGCVVLNGYTFKPFLILFLCEQFGDVTAMVPGLPKQTSTSDTGLGLSDGLPEFYYNGFQVFCV